MCGIAGLVGRGAETAAGEAAVAEAVECLRHRGPDAIGTRTFPGCVLGHTRLRIIDLRAEGDQPMANEDGGVWVVFNGEIYNFAELRAELLGAGHRFRSSTDTEVLVHLYEECGLDMAARLRGMFAFAVWDNRRRRLLLVRDRLGIKPLYYRATHDGLAFASELRVLDREGDSIDPAGLAGYLRLGWVQGPGTMLTGVSELPAGHRLTWQDGATDVTQWWSVPDREPGAPAPSTEELAVALREAMRVHLVADVPVGLFLSSGVDSVVLARLAAELSPSIHTYTVGFGTPDDESAEAATIAARLGLPHTLIPVSDAEARQALDPFTAGMDQPSVDGLNSWLIARAVREAGLVVALSGVGGDELFAGYSTFWHVPRLAAAGTSSAAPVLAKGAEAVLGRFGRTSSSRWRRAMHAIHVGGWDEAYAAVRGLFSPGELLRLWPPKRELAVDGVLGASNGHVDGARAHVGRLELTNYLPFQLLRDTDAMSMAHALEVRVPLLDDAVVPLALRGLDGPGPWGKRQLTAAVDPDLDYLVSRPKRTFTLPIEHWMRGRLIDDVEDALVALGDADLGFDRRTLTQVWHGFLAGRVGWRPVWALTTLGRWLGERHGRAVGALVARTP